MQRMRHLSCLVCFAAIPVGATTAVDTGGSKARQRITMLHASRLAVAAYQGPLRASPLSCRAAFVPGGILGGRASSDRVSDSGWPWLREGRRTFSSEAAWSPFSTAPKRHVVSAISPGKARQNLRMGAFNHGEGAPRPSWLQLRSASSGPLQTAAAAPAAAENAKTRKRPVAGAAPRSMRKGRGSIVSAVAAQAGQKSAPASKSRGKQAPRKSRATTTEVAAAAATGVQAPTPAVAEAKVALRPAGLGGDGPRLVIVESPAKARTIQRLLADTSDYIVDSCAGHVRDLPAGASQVPARLKKEKWSALGIDADNGFEPLYVILPGKKPIVDRLKKAAAEAREIILATDEDREGEAISWHLLQLLKPKVPVRRAVFHEITKSAVAAAFATPRDIDLSLVQAQEARRMMDRLAGYTMSPLLWRKISPGLSAGRVQSVGMAMVVRRESARLAFRSAEFWDLTARLAISGSGATAAVGSAPSAGADGGGAEEQTFEARLVDVDGVRVARSQDFDPDTGLLKAGDRSHASVLHLDREEAAALVARLEAPGVRWRVLSVELKRRQRRAPPPFITSTLQQECYKRLHVGAKQCMSIAQGLYENGFITYMRTDNPNLSSEARGMAAAIVKDRFGPEYAATGGGGRGRAPKGSQEAHEAIRPAALSSTFRSPPQTGLMGMERKVYELIYSRTIASVMAAAAVDLASAIVTATAPAGAGTAAGVAAATPLTAAFRASGRHVAFPGFMKAYGDFDGDGSAGGAGAGAAAGDGTESEVPAATTSRSAVRAAAVEEEAEGTDSLPLLVEGQTLGCVGVAEIGHNTQPPARYTEASFVKELEGRGVGRPSTYATILETLKERGYVTAARGALVPTLNAFVVTDLLSKYFPAFVDTAFTAAMEARLDDIAIGAAHRNQYLSDYYLGKKGLRQRVADIEKTIPAEEVRRARLPALEPLGDSIGVFVGPYGAYIQELIAAEPADASGAVGGRSAAVAVAVEGSSVNGAVVVNGADAESMAAAATAAAAAAGGADVAAAAASEIRRRGRKPKAEKGTVTTGAAAARTKAAAATVLKAALPREVLFDVEALTAEVVRQCLDINRGGGQTLGYRPGTRQQVLLKVGRYGPYVELAGLPLEEDAMVVGTAQVGSKEAATGVASAAPPPPPPEKRASLARGEDPAGVTLERALGLLSLPRVVCVYPGTEEPVVAGIGRFGPFVQFNGSFASVPAGEDVVSMLPERALEFADVLRAAPPRFNLGEHKGKPIRVANGRWGPYLKWGTVSARLPPEYRDDPAAMPLAEAIAAIQGKASRKKGKCSTKDIEDDDDADAADAATMSAKPTGRRIRASPSSTTAGRAAGGAKTAAAAAPGSAVKKPRSAYILFCGAKRPAVVAAAGGRASLGDTTRELARLWAAAEPTGERREWEAAAASDRQRYEREVAAAAAAAPPG